MCSSLTPLIISLTPTLINRVVLSLKKTADINNAVNRPWNTEHFTSMRFEPVSIPMTSETVAGQPLDDPAETLLDRNGYNDIPLDDLSKRTRSLSPTERFVMAPHSLA